MEIKIKLFCINNSIINFLTIGKILMSYMRPINKTLKSIILNSYFDKENKILSFLSDEVTLLELLHYYVLHNIGLSNGMTFINLITGEIKYISEIGYVDFNK